MIYKKTFTGADLNASYQLVLTHNLGTSDIIPSWKDENGIYRTIGDLVQIVDDNNIMLSCNEAIAGTHTLYLSYNEAGTSTAGRRLFELSAVTDPVETMRLPLGKASTPAVNITLTAFLAWLMTKLGFLKVASNLSDLQSAASARSNLSVYSQKQVDDAVALKATLYQAASGSVLGVNNASVYNPVSNYNPATLRNVKNIGFKLLLAGSVAADGTAGLESFRNSNVLSGRFTAERTATGSYKVSHNLHNTDYMVFTVTTGTTQNAIGTTKIYKYADYFYQHSADDSSLNDAAFDFFIVQFNPYSPNE